MSRFGFAVDFKVTYSADTSVLRWRVSMTSKKAISGIFPLRRCLNEAEAAVYLSLSPSYFRRLVSQGIMPRPRLLAKRRIWDIEELDLAFKSLPREHGGT